MLTVLQMVMESITGRTRAYIKEILSKESDMDTEFGKMKPKYIKATTD